MRIYINIRNYTFLTLVLFCLPLFGQKKWTIADILKVDQLSGISISPDGRYVLYTLSRKAVDDTGYSDLFISSTDGSQSLRLTNTKTTEVSPQWSPDSKWILYLSNSDLYVISSDGKKQIRLTDDKLTKTSPRWSPDSKWISYISDSKKSKVRQIWNIRSTGGKPVQLTKSNTSIQSYFWSPKRTHLCYITEETFAEEKLKYEKEWGVVISPEEKTWAKEETIWLKAIADEDATMLACGNIVSSMLKWSSDGNFIAFRYCENESCEPKLFLVDMSGDKKPKSVSETGYGVRFFSWSPDGKDIAYITAKENPPAYKNDFYPDIPLGPGSIWIYNDAKKISRKVTEQEYPRLSSFTWSPDSKNLLFFALPPETENEFRSLSEVFLIKADEEKVKSITSIDSYRGALSFKWIKGKNEVWFVKGDRMGSNIFALNLSDGKIRHITTGQDNIRSVTYSGSLVAFTRENVNMKPDIYVTELSKWEPRRITDINPWVREFSHGHGEIITYRSEGWDIDALFIRPPDFDPSKKYPLLLITHGGPTWYKLNDWCPHWEMQPIHAYAAEGFCMVFPNVRGSDNYGLEFRDVNHHDLGGCDFRDALRAVDYLLEQGFIDEDKLGVCGWSYGGYLTPSIITQTNRFKAAQFGAGIPSLEAMYARMATVEQLIPKKFDKNPWEDAQMQIQYSPLYSAKKVKTPTLIQHGEEDPRCPVGGAILFYKALKFYKVPVVLEIYPEQGHGISDPLLLRRILNKNLEWFSKWLKGDTTTSFERLFPSASINK